MKLSQFNHSVTEIWCIQAPDTLSVKLWGVHSNTWAVSAIFFIMHWSAGQCMVMKFSSVLRNSLTMNWEEILWPTVLLCGMGIEARVTGQRIKLCSTSYPHKLVLACPVSAHRHVHMLTSTTDEYLKTFFGQREYFISTVIYIFMGRMPFYMFYIAERDDDGLSNGCSPTFMAPNCT